MSSLKRKAGADDAAASDPKKAKQSSLMSFFGGGGGRNAASPKTPSVPRPVAAASTSTPTPNSAPYKANSKFDKAKWVAGLSKEQQQLLKLEIDTLGESWLALLKDDLKTSSFLDLKRFLCREHNAGRQIFPPPEDVYSWSRYIAFDDVKVVIVGQDPYHNVGQAHGLAFSVKPPIPAPPSLKNMYIALQKDYPGTFQVPKGGSLTAWAERGVLMLNTCLTVRAHEANSHANHGWERFTQQIIDLIAQRRQRGVVFMAWGAPAAKRVVKVDSNRHLVLRSAHPSPLSARRGFYDCHHFRLSNEWLMERYGADGEIDWSLVPGTTTIEGPKKELAKEDAEETETEETEETEEAGETEVEKKTKENEKKDNKPEDDDDDENKTDVEEEEETPTPATAKEHDVKKAVGGEDEKENVKSAEVAE
ncbi:uracil-dna glycosylase [Ophiostoma piceae UAMH 11346]|uniref:Uracil-DNA glycosylase n=1 Tax=Ophiostoma piceae (strain UAMH 11346) TaxID=1262450 RepID=S3D9S5_OPHP1|nr:uracil-dna glycosylase [Ophiostoma piceae UAMH 11346]